jgi:hypothetical protein
MIKQEAEKILNIKTYNRNTAHVECKNKSDTSNNRGDRNYLKVIQKIPGKAQNQGTAENSHIGTAHMLWKALM